MLDGTLGICTYNIHKGFSQLNRRMVIHELRESLQLIDADILLLQEVVGHHRKHARRHHDWPAEPQHEFLAAGDLHAAYGKNALYDHGHHGNAILSCYPIIRASNHDVSLYRLEQRGILHCEIALGNGAPALHCLCVHLSLTERQRHSQVLRLVEYVERNIPRRAALVVAGDFNDWRSHANAWMAQRLGMREAFTEFFGVPARSYPSALPVLRLDRIYLRGLAVLDARVYSGAPWSRISDHAPLFARVRLQ